MNLGLHENTCWGLSRKKTCMDYSLRNWRRRKWEGYTFITIVWNWGMDSLAWKYWLSKQTSKKTKLGAHKMITVTEPEWTEHNLY